MPSTQTSCPLVPAVLLRSFITQKIIAPTHIANVDSGGSTTPKPMATADNGKRPLVTILVTSIATAEITATIMDTTAVHGRVLMPLAISSATPFHCMAAGMENCSEMMVAVERTPFASGGRNS